MHIIKSLPDARRIVHYHIAEEIGWQECRLSKGQISWRIEKNGWISPRRVFIREYHKDIYRFSYDPREVFIKTIWPFAPPSVHQFELTAHASDITKEFSVTLMDFVGAATEGNPKDFSWPLFDKDRSYPGYAWSEKADEVYKPHRLQREKTRPSA